MKKRVIKSFENLTPDVINALHNNYPYGFEEKIQSIQDVIKGGIFKGLIFDHEDATYLIKFKNEEQIVGFPNEDEEDDYNNQSPDFDVEDLPDNSYDD